MWFFDLARNHKSLTPTFFWLKTIVLNSCELLVKNACPGKIRFSRYWTASKLFCLLIPFLKLVMLWLRENFVPKFGSFKPAFMFLANKTDPKILAPKLDFRLLSEHRFIDLLNAFEQWSWPVDARRSNHFSGGSTRVPFNCVLILEWEFLISHVWSWLRREVVIPKWIGLLRISAKTSKIIKLGYQGRLSESSRKDIPWIFGYTISKINFRRIENIHFTLTYTLEETFRARPVTRFPRKSHLLESVPLLRVLCHFYFKSINISGDKHSRTPEKINLAGLNLYKDLRFEILLRSVKLLQQK